MIEINKIYNEDCRETMARVQKDSIIIITDPPYNIGFNYQGYFDSISDNDYIELINNFKRIPSVFIHYPEEMIKYICPALGNPNKIVSWIYHSNLPRQHRTIAWFNSTPNFSKIKQPYKNLNDKRIKELIDNGSEGANLYDWWQVEQVKNVDLEKIDFPCQIPIEIIERIILLTTKENDLIYDPFMGSGTTAIACIKTNRNYIGSEISKAYCDLAEKRIKPYKDQLKLAI